MHQQWRGNLLRFLLRNKKKAQNLFDLVLFWYKYLNYLTRGLAYLVGIWFVPFVGCLPTSLERRCCKAGGRRSLLLVEISGQAVSRLFVHCVALDLIKLGVLTNSSPAETAEKKAERIKKGGKPWRPCLSFCFVGRDGRMRRKAQGRCKRKRNARASSSGFS